MGAVLSVVLAGLCCWGLLWVVAQPATRSEVPTYPKDTPWWLRCLWPWVTVCLFISEPFISWRHRRQLQQALARAGLARFWQASHVIALQLLLGCLSGAGGVLFAWWAGGRQWGWLCFAAGIGAIGGFVWPRLVLWQWGQARQLTLLKELPFMLDITTLCVEAGLNLQGALQQAARYCPPGPLRTELAHALGDMRAGVSRAQALQAMAGRSNLPALTQLVATLLQAETLGASLGKLLRAQADQQRSERFLRAEAMALKAPVKMLFPMVAFIFPCTFIILAFPVIHDLFAHLGTGG